MKYRIMVRLKEAGVIVIARIPSRQRRGARGIGVYLPEFIKGRIVEVHRRPMMGPPVKWASFARIEDQEGHACEVHSRNVIRMFTRGDLHGRLPQDLPRKTRSRARKVLPGVQGVLEWP